MADVFRKAALERLSSPEQLDKVITVSSPTSWLFLLGISIAIAAVIIWSVFGTLPTTLPAQGIAVSSADMGETQFVECFVSYADAGRISAGMKAVIHSADDDARFDAQVNSVSFDDEGFSDIDLVLNSGEIPVVISLELVDGTLPDKALVNVKIITEETAPLNLLFNGLRESVKG